MGGGVVDRVVLLRALNHPTANAALNKSTTMSTRTGVQTGRRLRLDVAMGEFFLAFRIGTEVYVGRSPIFRRGRFIL